MRSVTRDPLSEGGFHVGRLDSYKMTRIRGGNSGDKGGSYTRKKTRRVAGSG
jgi:hypothetical protein